MRKLMVAVAVLAAVGLVADRWADARAEREIEAAIEARVGAVGEVAASVESLPFLGRLLLTGDVTRLEVRLTRLAGFGLEVAELHVVGEGISLDRGLLLGERRVRVREVEAVRTAVTISEAEIRRATGVEVDLLADGGARVSIGGVSATVEATAAGGNLRFAGEGLPAVTLPLPTGGLLPCEPAVEVVADAVVASCESDRLPDLLLGAIG